MIEIKMTGMCEGCHSADLTISCESRGVFIKEWLITCSHWYACKAMREKMEERRQEDDRTEKL